MTERAHEFCLAAEWHRDGRGLWGMRVCLRDVGHEGQPHTFGSWRYNVQPPGTLAPAPQPSAPTCGTLLATEPIRFCGLPAVVRYPAMGGGQMDLCAEHGKSHAAYSEPIPQPSASREERSLRTALEAEIAAQEEYTRSPVSAAWPEMTPSHHRHVAAILRLVLANVTLQSQPSASREERGGQQEAAAIRYHKTIEGEYGCNGATCPGVKRLVTFVEGVIAELSSSSLSGETAGPRPQGGHYTVSEGHAQ